MRTFGFSTWCIGVILLGGCGEKAPMLVQVSGTVTKDGAGVTAGSIFFHPDQANGYLKDTPSSLLQLNGGFTMKTFPFGDGVPPGKYKVTLGPEVAIRIGCPKLSKLETTTWSIDVPKSGIDGHKFEAR